jgi:hypothetical protein
MSASVNGPAIRLARLAIAFGIGVAIVMTGCARPAQSERATRFETCVGVGSGAAASPAA